MELVSNPKIRTATCFFIYCFFLISHNITTILFISESTLVLAHNNNHEETSSSLTQQPNPQTAAASKALTLSLQNVRHTRATPVHDQNDFNSTITFGIPIGSFEYATQFGVGTPPQYLHLRIHTGSDITWFQCQYCVTCVPQPPDPIFDGGISGSFLSEPCSSPLCNNQSDGRLGCNEQGQCTYEVPYRDGSLVSGELVMETLSLEDGTQLTNVTLGCTHITVGLYQISGGVLGLGRGSLSFNSQLSSQFGISNKFSYCLVDPRRSNNTSSSSSSSSSSIMFGDSAVPSSDADDVIYTPIIQNIDAGGDPELMRYYYVNLTGISINGERVTGIDEATFRDGTIIDSFESATRLYDPAYHEFRNAFLYAAAALDWKLALEPNSVYDTCFNFTELSVVQIPTVEMHFSGGADVQLRPDNYLDDMGGGIHCLAFVESNILVKRWPL
ncbi:Peptidase A1 [Macleaya cordata]|uniref:Peptidase A1 n=1 Tax=Macleaya cordata TaxID=56857 RepID=A0A200QW59_MACCD|nr:Peptidase A1 [Macleaya cordata]